MHQYLKFIYFALTLARFGWSFIHCQEFETVHTTTDISQTNTATCLLAGTRWNISFSLAERMYSSIINKALWKILIM